MPISGADSQFAAEAHQQAMLVATAPTGADDQDVVDAISDWPDD